MDSPTIATPRGWAGHHAWRFGAAAGLLLLVLVSYSPVWDAGFIWDDDAYVVDNTTLRDANGFRRIWFEIGAIPQYYPLVHTTFWLEYQLWGLDPRGYHLVNVVLHALNTVLLWMVLRALSVPWAWLAAAVFGLHPVQVESVAWITERKNVLSAFFYLLALLSYVRFSGLDRSGPAAGGVAKESWSRYGWALALFVLALLSKTVTASLPAAILLLIWWKRGRVRQGDVAHLVPFFAIGAGLGLLTAHLERTLVGASGEIWDLTGWERVLVAGRALWFYAFKLIWPLTLSFNYERWIIDARSLWQYLFPVGAALVILVLAAKRHTLGRGPLVSVLYFAGTLVPALGFFNVYPFRYAFVADHFQYLACIGLIVLAVGSLARRVRWGTDGARAAIFVSACGVLILATLSWQQTRVYRNLENLWLDTLRKNPTSWLANNNLGNIYLRRGELEPAVTHFEAALASAPTYVETHGNIAIALMNLGHFERALHHAKRGVALAPESKFGYNTVGNVYLRSGQVAEAIPWFEQSLARDPAYSKAHNNLGVSLAQSGRFNEAIVHLEFVLEREPDHLSARSNLAIALARVGRDREAVHHFEAAIRLDPDNEVLRQNLSVARARLEGGGSTDDDPGRD